MNFLDPARHLEEKGIQLPAICSMARCKEERAWGGCCEKLAQPPVLSVLAKGKKKIAEKGAA